LNANELIGKLRASCELYEAIDRDVARADLALELRMLGDDAKALIDDAVVAYVADVAVSRELYTDVMRRRVTPDEVLALLTYTLGALSSAHPHHLALALGWWGERLCATLFDHEARLIYPINEMLYQWFPKYLESVGVDYFELQHAGGALVADVHQGGRMLAASTVVDQPWFTDDFAQFLALTFQREEGGFYYNLDVQRRVEEARRRREREEDGYNPEDIGAEFLRAYMAEPSFADAILPPEGTQAAPVSNIFASLSGGDFATPEEAIQNSYQYMEGEFGEEE